MSTENLNVRIEVEDSAVLLVFPRRMDHIMVPWQDAWRLGETLELAAKDVPHPPLILDYRQVIQDQGQLKIGTHLDKYVALFFQWSDRVVFCPEAATIAARGIRMKAQDLDYLENKRVKMLYVGKTVIPYCMEGPKQTFAPVQLVGG